MSRKKKLAIIAGSILILYSLIGFVVVPLILEYLLPGKLSEALDRPVTIENIRLNPFSLTVEVDGVNIKDKNGADPFVSFDSLFVNIQTLSLFKPGLVAKEIRLENPDIRIVRTAETEFNFSDLISENKSEPEPESETKTETPEDGEPFRFSISNIDIADGNITFQDEVVGTTHALSAINFNLPQISNFENQRNTYSKPLLTGDVNQAKVAIDAETKPFLDTMETTVHLSFSGVSIPHYFIYVPENTVGFKINHGRIDVDVRLSFKKIPDGKNLSQNDMTVHGTLGLAGLQIIENSGNTLLKLPDLTIDVAPSRPLEKELTLASVKIQSPELSVIRNPEGVINLTTLGPKSDKTKNDKAENGKPGTPTKALVKTSPKAASEQTAPKDPFILTIEKFLLDAGTVLFSDFAAASSFPDGNPVQMSVDDLTIKLSDFTTAAEKTATYDIGAMINKQAAISADGRLGITPLQIESDFNLKDVKLAWGQPYIPDTIALVITDGKFAASGHAAVRTLENGEIRTTVTGKAAVNEFNSTGAAENEAFISWNIFSVDGIDVSVNPLKINTDRILLKDFKNRVIIFDNGESNIGKIFTASASETSSDQEAPEPDAAETQANDSDTKDPKAKDLKTKNMAETQQSSPVIPVSIGEMVGENLEFDFIDKNISPRFSTRLNLSELRVTGLTSEDFKAADLTAQGTLNNHAPIKINGKLNPLRENLYLDVTYRMKNMELSPLSPYTGKYIGRTIEKGKLVIDVDYKIEDKVVSARNHLLLDQFSLGRQVESPEALNLPVGLAVALLKDRNGRINVDLPISGRTDDPSFGIGKPLLNALKNLIVKAAASPFALVGSIVGGGEELRYIEFSAGSAQIDEQGAEKLGSIQKLMYERPELKLDIAGYADMESDRVTLADKKLARKIKALTLKKGAAKDNETIDKIALPPEEYEKLLKEVYAEKILSDPEKKQTAKSLKDPELTIEEMESLLRGQIPITDAELRLLAVKRAGQVKDYLLAGESVTADRIFLTEPEQLMPKKAEGFKPSRVELDLR